MRTRNSHQYNKALVQRGSLSFLSIQNASNSSSLTNENGEMGHWHSLIHSFVAYDQDSL